MCFLVVCWIFFVGDMRDTLRLMTNSRSKRGREEEEKRQGQGRGKTREKEGPRTRQASERQQRGRQVLEGHQGDAHSHAAPATEPPQLAGRQGAGPSASQ